MSYSDYRKQVQSILANAGFYSGVIDGEWGSITKVALLNLSQAKDVAAVDNPTSPATAPATGTGPVMDTSPVDSRSEENIETLHPRVRPYARGVVNAAMEKGIRIKVTSGTRTPEEQNALYEVGRTTPGKIVTDARAWQSNHNYGLAFDFTIFDGASPIWDSPLYKTVGEIGESFGLTWGGRWHNADEPHLEMYPEWAKGLEEAALISALRTRHAEGKDAFA